MNKNWFWFWVVVGVMIIGAIWHFGFAPRPPEFSLPESLTHGDEVLDFEVE